MPISYVNGKAMEYSPSGVLIGPVATPSVPVNNVLPSVPKPTGGVTASGQPFSADYTGTNPAIANLPPGAYINPAGGISYQQGYSAPTTASPADQTSAIESQALQNIASTPAPEDPNAIYQRKLQQSQGLIDSITQQFGQMLNAQTPINEANVRATNIENAAAGLVGSPNAYTNINKTDVANKGAMDLINSQKQTQIAGILKDVQTQSDAELKAEQDAYRAAQSETISQAEAIRQGRLSELSTTAGVEATKAGTEATKQSIETQKLANQKSAQDNFSKLAALSGISWDDYLKRDPQGAQSLLNQTGFSPNLAPLVWDAQKSASQRTQWDLSNMQTLADGRSMVVGLDPMTGQLKTQYLDTAPNGYQTILKDGLPYWEKLDANGQGTGVYVQAPLNKDQQTPDYKNYLLSKSGGYQGTFDEWLTADANRKKVVNTYNILPQDQQQSAITGMVQYYMTTGQLPSFPYGNAGVAMRQQFWAAVGATGSGGIGGAQANKASISAMTSSLRTQQTQYSANQTSLGTFDKQLTLLDDYSSKVDRTGSPILNKYLLWAKGQAQGDADTAAFNNIVKTASMEFAKIMSGSSASIAGVTVSSSDEAEKLINSSMSSAQLKEVFSAMRKEGQFRLDSQKKTIDDLQADIGNIGQTTPTDTSTPADTDYLKSLGY